MLNLKMATGGHQLDNNMEICLVIIFRTPWRAIWCQWDAIWRSSSVQLLEEACCHSLNNIKTYDSRLIYVATNFPKGGDELLLPLHDSVLLCLFPCPYILQSWCMSPWPVSAYGCIWFMFCPCDVYCWMCHVCPRGKGAPPVYACLFVLIPLSPCPSSSGTRDPAHTG